MPSYQRCIRNFKTKSLAWSAFAQQRLEGLVNFARLRRVFPIHLSKRASQNNVRVRYRMLFDGHDNSKYFLDTTHTPIEISPTPLVVDAFIAYLIYGKNAGDVRR